MEPLSATIVTSIATGYFVNFTTSTVKDLFEKAFKVKPSLENELQCATTSEDFEKVFEEAVGVIDLASEEGKIEVNKSLLEALRGIRFDHKNGIVIIQGTALKAPVLQTGGKGTGMTSIKGNSELESEGTRISVGEGAYIEISGNAWIRQN